MSDLYKEAIPNQKNLKNCPECHGEITRDILQQQLEKRKKLIDAKVCEKCQIIWERIDE